VQAEASQQPAQRGAIVLAAMWGGSLVLVNAIVVVLVAVTTDSLGVMVWAILMAIAAGLVVGLGAGMPGMSKGISILSAATAYLILWLVMMLASRAPLLWLDSGILLLSFFSLVCLIAYGGGLYVQRDYARSLTARLMVIGGASLLILLLLTGAILLAVTVFDGRSLTAVLFAIALLMVALWSLAVMIMALINGIRQVPSVSREQFVSLGIVLGVGALLVTILVFTIVACVNEKDAWLLLAFVLFATAPAAAIAGLVGAGDMVRQILFATGHQPEPRPEPEPTVAAPPKPEAPPPPPAGGQPVIRVVAQPSGPAPVGKPPKPSIEQRLGKLKRLFTAGEITESEYDERRKEILKEV